MIDKIEIFKTLRTTLLDAEIVLDGTLSGNIGIRDGEYNAGQHTRPNDPDPLRIIEPEELDVIERGFDSGNLSLFVRETLLHSIDTKTTTNTPLFAGIYELSVFVPSDNGAVTNLSTALDTVRYIQNIFDPSKPYLTTDQLENVGICIDSVNTSNGFIDQDSDAHYRIPVNIEFRCWNRDLI